VVEQLLRQLVREAIREELAELEKRLKVMLEAAQPSAATVYLTTEQAAKIASVEPDTIRQWVKDGHVKRYGHGRLRVKAADLEAYLERRSVRAVAPEDIQARVERAAVRLLR
jgi:excisionase family DNA binding protein